MGIVYRAHDHDLGRDVAIKLVSTSDAPSDTLATRLMREAQALAQLSHPNVVGVFDVGRVDFGVFLAMELVEGLSGDIWLKRQPSWREVLSVFRDAGRGLAAAHRVGLVHRDFKPANLMIGNDGRVRVLDFGLARAAHAGGGSDSELPSLADDGRSLAGPSGAHATVATVPDQPNDGPGDEPESWSYETTPGKPRSIPVSAPSPPTPTPSTRQRPSTIVDGPQQARSRLVPAPAAREPNAPALPRTPERSSPSGTGSAGTLLDTPLTQIGSIIGTPPYMAPEQHQGGGCDARTDQFSFCVAFYQGLYGERPFDGRSYAELSRNIIKGHVKPAPHDSKVPAWIRAIVLRGLDVNPEKRWPSMDAILDALERDPAARRRRIGSVVAIGLMVGAASFASWRGMRGPGCNAAAGELRNVWDASRKEAVQAAFVRTKLPYAADSFTAVARALDGYASAWVAMHVDACEATHVKATQSPELFDLRMQCLSQRLDDLRAQVDLFAAADADVVTRAAAAAQALPGLEGCADAEALRAPVRPPADAGTRTRVDGARKTLATVRALWEGGRYADAQSRLGPVLADARAIGWRPLEAEALLQSARLRDSAGDYAGAGRDYRDAEMAAQAGRADEVAALAADGLVWISGERLGKYAEAHEAARDAQAKIDRLGGRDVLQADLDAKVATLYLEEGKYQEALERSQRVLAARQKMMRADDPHIASAMGDVADVLGQLGRYDEAIALYRRALDSATHAVGADHPMCSSLHTNLGAMLHASGHNAEALAEYQRAQEITEHALGPEHPQIATIAANLGGILLDEGRFEEAATQFKRALALWQKALGADHPNVATAHYRLGTVAMREGKPLQARADFERALTIWQAKLGPEHPSLSAALDGLGDALMAEHQPAEAEVRYKRAVALLEKALGPKDANLGEGLTGIGLAELAQHAPELALPPLERALPLRQLPGSDPVDLAHTRFTLARALRATGGDEARATQLAQSALVALQKAGKGSAREAAEVEKWLRGR
jgi:serine/threonine protein kinase/tetratricopeptide (TPR) repeat protein